MKRTLPSLLRLLAISGAVFVCLSSVAFACPPQRGMDYGPNNDAQRNGYAVGFRYGQHDRNVGKPFRPTDSQAYQDAKSGYNDRFGSRDQYKVDFRQGYVRGYEDGYNGRTPYRDNRDHNQYRDRDQNNDWQNNGRDQRDRMSPGERNGYLDGLRYGTHDREVGKPSRPTDSQAYQDAKGGYDSRYGNRDQYKVEYRRGYERGYLEGFSGRSRYRDNGNVYGNRDQDYGRNQRRLSEAEQNGYADGLRYGRHDREVGKPSRPTDSQAYNDADSGYNVRFGSRDQYKVEYRRGYVRGYEQGYSGRYDRR